MLWHPFTKECRPMSDTRILVMMKDGSVWVAEYAKVYGEYIRIFVYNNDTVLIDCSRYDDPGYCLRDDEIVESWSYIDEVDE